MQTFISIFISLFYLMVSELGFQKFIVLTSKFSIDKVHHIWKSLYSFVDTFKTNIVPTFVYELMI